MKTSLPTRRLGSGGPEITTLGFGAWAAGGGGWAFGWGPQDDEQSVAAIHHAVGAGVGWIDTAAVYGYGHSEAVVGRALASLPPSERPLVFTKCGLLWDEKSPMTRPRRDSRPARIRQECHDSLRRLGVDAIDLYQFHWPDESGTPVEDSWAQMLRLTEEGKIRFAGVSNYDLPRLERCAAVGHVQSLQPPFSLIRRDAAAAEIPWCAAHGTGVIVYSPMQSGLLTDSYSVERSQALAPDDWRRQSPQHQPPKLQQNLALRDALRAVAARHGATVSAVAVAWTLAWPGVSGAIVGARSPGQVDGWLEAAALRLDAPDLGEIRAAIERTGAGSGPVAPA
jgi:aryl-alcohol dehydrogenase-like predicted oxidoreductase